MEGLIWTLKILYTRNLRYSCFILALKERKEGFQHLNVNLRLLVLLHPRPSADGFECWFLRQTAALFHLRHTYQTQFLTHHRFILPRGHRKG